MKKIVIILGVILLVIITSGCTSNQENQEYKTYNSNQLSFQYPNPWTIENQGNNWVRFKAPDGLIRVGVDNSEGSNIDLTNFQDSKKIGNNTCYIMANSGTKTYLVKKNGKDLTVIGSVGESSGMEKIVETFQFK